ncbi:MAG: T9SS type A sorting domain-containing protein, partial [Bacteroidales bacterium]|nr:T9SS type A sorting domain-containing protein [Bacteroidales bacterium]
MKTKIFLSVLALGLMFSAFGQKPVMELTFTAIDSIAYVQLDSIKVMNRTQGGDTTLYWPDTVLVLDYQVGIPDHNNEDGNFQVFQNFPNPVTDQTTISLFIPEKDEVGIIITDLIGRVIIKSDRLLDKGTHFFRFTPGEGNLYFFTAQWRCNSSSIKILQTASNSYGKSSLEYKGSEASSPQLKATADIQNFLFNLGDELLYIGYANGLQSGMLNAPEASETYTFQFATNIPCPGTPTVEYEGQVYNTIQIFSQCWLKE